MSDNTSTTTKLRLKPVEIAVGAGAAVITAFATSFLGAAGTLVGAALASIVATVSTSVLRTSAERTNESLRRTNAQLRQRWRLPPEGAIQPPGAAAEGSLPGAGSRRAGSPEAADPPGATPAGEPPGHAALADPAAVLSAVTGGQPGGRPVRSRKPRWYALAAGAAAAFVVAMVLITGVESAIGKPLAGLFGKDHSGRSTIGVPVRNEPAGDSDQRPGGTESPSPSETGSPTGPSTSPSPTTAPAASSPAPPSSQPAPSSPAPGAPLPTGAPTATP